MNTVNLAMAATYCRLKFLNEGVVIRPLWGIEYQPEEVTETGATLCATIGEDWDPEDPHYTDGQIIHEWAHYVEGYEHHRHQYNWGLDALVSELGDYAQEAYDRESVVDFISWLIHWHFNTGYR